MHLAVLPDLAPVIRAKNEAVAWNYTLKVTQHFTHTRDNSRGISSDISRNHLLEESIDLSLDKSRGIFIKTLHDISTPDGMHISCDHLIKNPITIARQIGTRLMVYFQVKIRKIADTWGVFLTGKIFRSREEIFSDQDRKYFPPNNIQRRKSRELR